MRQYELAIRIAQVHHLVDERKYKKALAVIQTLDMRQVRTLSDLRVFAEVYTKTEQYDAAKATYLRIYRRSHTKRVLYRLIYLSIRTNALNDAEAYYQEFVRMNPNARDALILRYRIDKASGAPIGQLIDILQELKKEEYIEEWAYELAKLYHRAGRKEECKEECQDIILWFGMGEIVERAKILIDHLDEEDANFYYDDKDFTVPKKEEPNPEDTGSLPDLNEYVRGRKNQKREERREIKNDTGKVQREELPKEEKETEDIQEPSASGGTEKSKKPEDVYSDEFVDDYEDDYFDEEIDLPQKAKEGIHKLSGFLKLGKKEEAEDDDLRALETEKEKDTRAERKQEKSKNAPIGQENTEKAAPEERRREASQEHRGERKKSGLPEQHSAKREDASAPYQEDSRRHSAGASAGKDKISGDEEQIKIGFVPHSQSGMGITQDLAKEISAIYEMEQREQLKEKAVTVIHDSSNIAANVVERMTQAVQKNIGKSYIPLDIEEIQPENSERMQRSEAQQTVSSNIEEPAMQEEQMAADEVVQEENKQVAADEVMQEENKQVAADEVMQEENEQMAADEVMQEENEQMAANEVMQEEPIGEVSEEELKERALTRMLEEEVAEIQKNLSRDVILDTSRQDTETLKSLLEEEIEEGEVFDETQQAQSTGTEDLEMESVEPAGRQAGQQEPVYGQEEELAEEVSVSQEEYYQQELTEQAYIRQPAGDRSEQQASVLEGYKAPEIPVVETSYMEMPEITYDELPTTRALQQSFENVLKLIQGELDPSHFVLMGDGTERIVGVAKQIVRVMKATGYLSQGRIAKIHAKQINKMDLISFRSQLKGNCLLIEGASDLLFPTITRLFSIMEEYYGNFVVILVDEGTTLDQLFRFVPALARKFKYIIDISKYTPEDYLI